jgi:hypothetical protein
MRWPCSSSENGFKLRLVGQGLYSGAGKQVADGSAFLLFPVLAAILKRLEKQ